MAKRQTDHLFQLIKSLSKAEKRSFKLYAKRAGNHTDPKFIRLFDVLDKQSDYREEQIFQKVPNIKRRQLSNLKAHLYKQLLISLRLNERNHDPLIQIRENLDFSKVLYNKGLYRQSLKLLEKAKSQAGQNHYYNLVSEIIEFEKHIEAHHKTYSRAGRAEELGNESLDIQQRLNKTAILSNLSLQLYELFLRVGHSRNESEFRLVYEFFHSRLPNGSPKGLSFFEKLYLFEAHVWYNYIIQDFLMCYKYAQKWVDLFESDPAAKQVYPDIYIKGLHTLLASLYNLQYHSRFLENLEKLLAYKKSLGNQLSANTEAYLTTIICTHRINLHLMEGTFSEGSRIISDIDGQVQKVQDKVDVNRIMLINYKLACMKFASGDNQEAIHYLFRITNNRNTGIREDIQCFARILNLIAHYEIGNNEHVEYQVRSVYRFLIKMNNLQAMQRAIFHFLRKLSSIRRTELKVAFIELKTELEGIAEDPYLLRPFLYLDIISWLESKIEERPVQEVIRSKFLKTVRPSRQIAD